MAHQDSSPLSKRRVDRISQLPDDIIHRILSYTLTIDAVRLSLVSRRWRHVWRSVPSLTISYNHNRFRKANTSHDQPSTADSLFNRFTEEYLTRRHDDLLGNADSIVTSFKLNLCFSPAEADALTRLLSSPRTLANVKELDLSALLESSYRFPHKALNSRSLSVLKLWRVRLGSLDCAVSLPSLRRLRLATVWLSDEALDRLLLGCPSLERLEMRACSNLKRPKISSSSLLSVQLQVPHWDTVCIHALNLRSLEIQSSYQEADFSACAAIRNLGLHISAVDDKLFRDIEHTFTALECLQLDNCTMLKDDGVFRISSRSLTSFTMNNSYNVPKLEATFETPNLVSFYYKGDLRFGMAMNSPNDRLNGTVVIGGRCSCSQLLNFFSGLHWSCNMLTVNLHSFQIQIVIQSGPDQKHMELDHCHLAGRKAVFKSALESFEPMPERNSSFGEQMRKAIHRIVEECPTESPY